MSVAMLIFRIFGGLGASFIAVASHRMWQAAARNSASPGAIVLLGIAGVAALCAMLAGLSIAIQLWRRE